MVFDSLQSYSIVLHKLTANIKYNFTLGLRKIEWRKTREN